MDTEVKSEAEVTPTDKTIAQDTKFMIMNYHSREFFKQNPDKVERSKERKLNCPNCGYTNWVKYSVDKFDCTHCKMEIRMNVLVMQEPPKVEPTPLDSDEIVREAAPEIVPTAGDKS